MAISLALPLAAAHGAPAAEKPADIIQQGNAEAPKSSIAHSAAKATTFKIATTLTNLAIFSVGTGGVVGGGILTAFNITKSWGLFTANDYLWDKYIPTETNKDGSQAFDTKASFWRTTGKFLTYKPVDTAVKFASIYIYTGSAATMLVYGTASAVVNTGIFYANDLAWDLYDWSAAPSPPAPQTGRLAEALPQGQ